MASFQNSLQSYKQQAPVQQSQPEQQPKQGFLRTLGQEIAEPFAKVAATGEKSLSQLLLGKNTSTDADFTRNVLGREVGPAKTGREFAGALLEAGSNFIPVGAGAKAIGTVAKTGLKTIPTLANIGKVAGKSAALTGVAGGLSGTGEALQEPTVGIKDIMTRAGIGAGIGGVVGGLAPLAGRAIQIGASKAGSKTAQQAEQEFIQNVVPQKLSKAKETLSTILPQNASLRNKVREGTGMDVEELIIAEGIPFSKKGNNLFDFTEAIDEIVPTRKTNIGTTLQELLNSTNKTGKLSDIERMAIQDVQSSPKYVYGKNRDKLVNEIKATIAREREDFGDEASMSILNRIKSAGYDNFEKTTTDAEAGKAISRVIKKYIEQAFDDGTTQGNIVRELNNRYGNLIVLENYLKKTQDRPIRGGIMGKKLNQIIGAVAGSQGGPFGAIFGSEVAGRITDAIVDPTRINKAIIKDMQKAGILPQSIKTIAEAQKIIQTRRTDLIKRLFTPQVAIPARSTAPINLPSEGILQGQRNIQNFSRPTVGKTVAKNEEAFGALGGFEVYTDENGEKKVRFNPEKGAAGVALMAGVTNPKVQKAISKKADDITSSIQKAKASGQSFDDWVKGQGKEMYHGSNEVFDITKAKPGDRGMFGEGVYFAGDKKNVVSAKNTIDAILPKNAKVFETDLVKINKFLDEKGFTGNRPPFWSGTGGKEFSEFMKSQRYDAIILKNLGKETGIVLNPKVLKTRSQLKAEWDKN